ncbi:hypothetical protein BGI36_09340 [Snodgrassella communis]|nr:hypothetical protein BGI36_09340 [Snodgrassella communis]PIT24804.1 hypothetical protein BGI35_00345 [Snodgrassella communis]
MYKKSSNKQKNLFHIKENTANITASNQPKVQKISVNNHLQISLILQQAVWRAEKNRRTTICDKYSRNNTKFA